MRARRLQVVAACSAATLLTLIACGQGGPSPDGGQVGPPIVFDAGIRPDAGASIFDGGQGEREAACDTYCSKLFDCGYFPLIGIHPPGFTTSDCVYRCSVLSGFPPQTRRDCVSDASCTCDGGTCHTVNTCFDSDGGF